MRSYALGGTFFEPLNIMCSKKCEMPVVPGDSSRDPTRYHCQNEIAGTVWSSWSSTVSPFGSTWRSTRKDSADSAGPAAGATGAAGFFFAARAGAAGNDAITSRAARDDGRRMEPPGIVGRCVRRAQSREPRRGGQTRPG